MLRKKEGTDSRGEKMVYRCAKCGEKIAAFPEGVIRCPSCANKIIYKVRDNVAKDIKAR